MKMKYEYFEDLITLIRDNKEPSSAKLLIILTKHGQSKMSNKLKMISLMSYIQMYKKYILIQNNLISIKKTPKSGIFWCNIVYLCSRCF